MQRFRIVLALLAVLSSGVLMSRTTEAGPLASYGNNAGEQHPNENHYGESLVFINLSQANVNGCDFRYGNLTGANLAGASFYNVNFSYATLLNANLTDGYGVYTKYVGANLSGADLSGGNNFAIDLSGANLENARLSTYLVEATFAGARLRNADFASAYLWNTNFLHTDLSGAKLAQAGGLNNAVFDATSLYDTTTTFPAGFSPAAHNMTLVPEPSGILLLFGGAVSGIVWRSVTRRK